MADLSNLDSITTNSLSDVLSMSATDTFVINANDQTRKIQYQKIFGESASVINDNDTLVVVESNGVVKKIAYSNIIGSNITSNDIATSVFGFIDDDFETDEEVTP